MTTTSNRQAKPVSTPTRRAPAGPNAPADQRSVDAQVRRVGGEPKSVEQRGQWCADTRATRASLFDPTLSILAEALDDAENVRKAQANRLRIFTATGADKDGITRNFNLSENDPAVVALAMQIPALKALETQLTKALEKQLKAHPLGPFVLAQKGLGLKTVARLLAAIGDPYWNARDDRPRTVGQLFAFCGIAGPGYAKRKGQQVSWNPAARMRLWNIVQPIIKGNGPYRAVYVAARERYAEALHAEPCARCGPAGKPASEGSPLSLAHQHARAERLVMREVARDLWTEAKRLHELGTGHTSPDSHTCDAGADSTRRSA